MIGDHATPGAAALSREEMQRPGLPRRYMRYGCGTSRCNDWAPPWNPLFQWDSTGNTSHATVPAMPCCNDRESCFMRRRDVPLRAGINGQRHETRVA